MAQKRKAKRLFSRRDFLKGVPLGIAGGHCIHCLVGQAAWLGCQPTERPSSLFEGLYLQPQRKRQGEDIGFGNQAVMTRRTSDTTTHLFTGPHHSTLATPIAVA